LKTVKIGKNFILFFKHFFGNFFWVGRYCASMVSLLLLKSRKQQMNFKIHF